MNQKFQEFISFIAGNKDIALAISDDGMELAGWEEQLVKASWQKAKTAVDLVSKVKSGGKFYLLFNQFTSIEDLKPAYDLACQYPAGQVSLFNLEKMKNIALSPDYANTGIIYLFTKDLLEQAKKNNFQFLGTCGLTFKN